MKKFVPFSYHDLPKLINDINSYAESFDYEILDMKYSATNNNHNIIAVFKVKEKTEKIDKEKEHIKKIVIPTEDEFLIHCQAFLHKKYLGYEFSLKAKYESWVQNGWKDGHNRPIKNWKSKIKNVVPFLKYNENGKTKGQNLVEMAIKFGKIDPFKDEQPQ